MHKTIKEQLKEIRKEFNLSLNKLRSNIYAVYDRVVWGFVYDVIYKQGSPLYVLVDLHPEFRPENVPLNEIYLFGASPDAPDKGVLVEVNNSTEDLIVLYGVNLEKSLIGRSIEIRYRMAHVNNAIGTIKPLPGKGRDLRYLYKSQTCGKSYGKYSGV